MSAATRQSLKRGVKAAAYATAAVGGYTRRILRARPEPALRVLMYHKVNWQPGNSVTVTPDQFREQLAILVRNYSLVSPEALLETVVAGGVLPARAALLTFDDGYRDNLEHAYPVLRDLGLRALLFPATGFIGTAGLLPHDEGLAAVNPMLSWPDLRAMRDVFTIGSHAVSHRVLTTLRHDEARSEITSSKAVIEDRLGTPVHFFSYPKGSRGHYSAALEDEVARAGYACSFSTVPGGNSIDHVRTGSLLRRYNAEPLPPPLFRRLVEGSCDSIAWKDSRHGSAAKKQLNRLLHTTTR
jgi:peptidoglycan/xylan/chitin deacetylase (PgdA/CDA1 family)